MVNLKFYMNKNSLKPKTTIDDITFLFDTGADTPVWCKGNRLFEERYPEAEMTNLKFRLSGFGTGHSYVDVYRLPQMKLTDGNECIAYQNLYVAVTRKFNIGTDWVIPSTMFRKMKVSIDFGLKDYILSIHSENEIKTMFVRKITSELIDDIKGKTLLANVYVGSEKDDHF